MINLAQIITSIVAGILDRLKVASPRWWALTGALVIAIENIILAHVFPFTNQIPAVAVEALVGIAAIFLNSRSFQMATAVPTTGESIGDWVNRQLAILIDKFKTGSLTAFAVVQSMFIGFKFYIIADPTLTWGDTTVNIILSVLMLFLTPKTSNLVGNVGNKQSKMAA